MIICTYCGYKCPDDAHICPNCGKPLISKLLNHEPTFDNLKIKESLRRERESEGQNEPASPKKTIGIACVTLLIMLLIYKAFF